MKQMAGFLAERVEIKVVGKSGQISLGKGYAGKTLRLERRRDGTVVLTAVAMVPESQLWTLKEPHRSRIERGLAWAAATAPQATDVASLLKRRTTRLGRRRDRGVYPPWEPTTGGGGPPRGAESEGSRHGGPKGRASRRSGTTAHEAARPHGRGEAA